MLCYNGYSTLNLNGYSPYELVFGHKMTLSQELELKVDTVVSGTFTDYYEKLKKNLKYMGERLQKFRSQRLDMLNRNRQYHAFEIGQIVYMYQARGSMVQTGSRKIACFFVGSLVIYKAVGPQGWIQGGPRGPGPPLTTKNEAPAPKCNKTEAPEWQF